MAIIVRLTSGQAAALISTVATILGFFVTSVFRRMLPLYAVKTLLSTGRVELTPFTDSIWRNLSRLIRGGIRNRGIVLTVTMLLLCSFLPSLLIPDLVPLGIVQTSCDSFDYTDTLEWDTRISDGVSGLGPLVYLVGQVSSAVLRSRAAGIEHPVRPSGYSDHPDFVVMDAEQSPLFKWVFRKSERVYLGSYEAAFSSKADRSFSESSFELLNVRDDWPTFNTISQNSIVKEFDDVRRIVTFPMIQVQKQREERRDILFMLTFDTNDPIQLVEGLSKTFRGEAEVRQVIVERNTELGVATDAVVQAIAALGGLDGTEFGVVCDMASTAYFLAVHANSNVKEVRNVQVYRSCQDITMAVWSMVGIAGVTVLTALALAVMDGRVFGVAPILKEAGNASLPVTLLLRRGRTSGCAESTNHDVERVEACLTDGGAEGQEHLTIYDQEVYITAHRKGAIIK